MSKLIVNEWFGPTIQGEGKYTGVPSFFIRLNGCNLCCRWKTSDGSYTVCDTAYTSHNPEPPAYKTAEEMMGAGLLSALRANPNVTHIVITGGEPMLQQQGIVDLICNYLINYHITIETNGSITPVDNLMRAVNLWSVSPKLSTSGSFESSDLPISRQRLHEKNRINKEAIDKINRLANDCQFKFVWTGPECEQEIRDLMHGINPNRIYLMPEGITPDEIQASAESGALDACYHNGWRFCDREHIRLFGNKRGV